MRAQWTIERQMTVKSVWKPALVFTIAFWFFEWLPRYAFLIFFIWLLMWQIDLYEKRKVLAQVLV